MSLIEVVVAVAIVVLVAAAGLALAQGSRGFATRSAAAQFDAALAYAQSLAANSGNGATLVFTAASGGGGFDLTIFSGRPSGAGTLQQAPTAPIHAEATVSEAKLGGVPFTIFLNSAGHASAMSGAVTTASVVASDPGCPSGESAVVLSFSDSHTTDTRSVPCNTAVAGSPVTVGTVAP
jgi:type II secretory pathway pseudopilin PulG